MSDPSGRAPRVLIVDDELEVAKALRRLLGRRSFEARVALSGEEGLAMFEAFAPDAVISDYRMPGMNGVQFLEAVKRRTPSAARFLISGQTDLCTAPSHDTAGHVVIGKPWDNDQLVALLRCALERRGGA